MKKIFIAFLLLMLPMGAFAGNKLVNNRYSTLSAEETVEGNYYAAGERVDVLGTVNGDVIVAGGLINVSGNVTGDVIVAGGTVNISGTIQGDLRVAGGDVNIASVVGKNATVFAGNVYMTADSAIGESLDVFAGNIDLNGSVEDNVRSGSGALAISGSIGENLWAKVGEVDSFVLQSTAKIGGNISYSSPTAAKVITGATIEGALDYTVLSKNIKESADVAIIGFLIGLFWFFLFSVWLGIILIGLLLIHFLPKAVELVNKQVTRNFWPSFGWGLFVIFLGPVLAGVLFSTLVLWPLAVLVLLVYGLYMISGVVMASIYIGEWSLKNVQKRHLRGVSLRWSLLLGVTLFMIIAAIPLIGWLFKLIAIATAIGAIKAVDIKEMKRYK